MIWSAFIWICSFDKSLLGVRILGWRDLLCFDLILEVWIEAMNAFNWLPVKLELIKMHTSYYENDSLVWKFWKISQEPNHHQTQIWYALQLHRYERHFKERMVCSGLSHTARDRWVYFFPLELSSRAFFASAGFLWALPLLYDILVMGKGCLPAACFARIIAAWSSFVRWNSVPVI